MEDHYGALGISEQASLDDIRRAFHKLARSVHPDINTAPSAAQDFQRINQSYQVLSDPDLRRHYDIRRLLEKKAQQSPRRKVEEAVRKVSEAVHDSLWGRPHRHSSEQAEKQTHSQHQDFSSNVHTIAARVRLSFSESFCGSTRSIGVQLPVRGKSSALGPMLRHENISVQIPAGVGDGDNITLLPQSLPTWADDCAINVHIVVTPSDRFSRKGNDLYTTLDVKVSDAILGLQVKVPTPSANIAFCLSPGTQHEQIYRIKDEGFVHAKGRGDLYVEIRVRIPTKLPHKANVLLEKLAAEFSEF